MKNEKCKKCHPELVSGSRARHGSAFTLPEILIAVSIFSVVVTLASSLYIQSFREARRANMQNQIYEDARFIMARIGDEVRSGMIDYDEYFNQNVIRKALDAAVPIPGTPDSLLSRHFGQNYGRYFSAFFHAGNDNALGFDCNTVVVADGDIGTPARTAKRNKRNCTPLRRTLDRNTGSNPFPGKATGEGPKKENAFCGTVREGASTPLDNKGESVDTPSRSFCPSTDPAILSESRRQPELYLISADGRTKTILAREKIGAADNAYALSILRLKGVDTNQDSLPDRFVCADEFQCRGDDFDVRAIDGSDIGISTADIDCPTRADTLLPSDLPRLRDIELSSLEPNCDTAANGFSKDFVPISPFRIKITDLKFYIAPLENPHYAFAESDEQAQPRVTIVLTVANNPDYSGSQDAITPLTLVQTVSSRVLTPIPAPLLVR